MTVKEHLAVGTYLQVVTLHVWGGSQLQFSKGSSLLELVGMNLDRNRQPFHLLLGLVALLCVCVCVCVFYGGVGLLVTHHN